MAPTKTTGLTGDLMVGPDGNFYFTVPSQFHVGRFALPDAGMALTDTFPTKFNVGPEGEPCTSSNELPVDLNVLFSAGVFRSCDNGTFLEDSIEDGDQNFFLRFDP